MLPLVNLSKGDPITELTSCWTSHQHATSEMISFGIICIICIFPIVLCNSSMCKLPWAFNAKMLIELYD